VASPPRLGGLIVNEFSTELPGCSARKMPGPRQRRRLPCFNGRLLCAPRMIAWQNASLLAERQGESNGPQPRLRYRLAVIITEFFFTTDAV